MRFVTLTILTFFFLPIAAQNAVASENIEPPAMFLDLEGVIIEAGENPADRIIREVIANRRINNPENISSFRFQSHNKIIVDFRVQEDYYRIINDTLTVTAEMLQQSHRRLFHGGYVMMSETVTERQFLYPNRTQETILGSRVS